MDEDQPPVPKNYTARILQPGECQPSLQAVSARVVMPPLNAGKSFAVPATAGQYAPEYILFGSTSPSTPSEPLLGVTALVESAPAGAVVELWLPKFTGNQPPTVPTDYVYSGWSITGGAETWPLASWRGALLRVKSGGTAGSAVVSASADF